MQLKDSKKIVLCVEDCGSWYVYLHSTSSRGRCDECHNHSADNRETGSHCTEGNDGEMEDNGFDLNLKPCASRESAAVTESSSSQSTASPVGTEWGDQFTDRAIPAARFSAHQRVYAKDDVTGLLFMAVVRKSTWGPADTSSSAFCSSLVAANNANEADCEQQQPVEKDDDDNEGWSHHHFVHYLGKVEVISLCMKWCTYFNILTNETFPWLCRLGGEVGPVDRRKVPL